MTREHLTSSSSTPRTDASDAETTSGHHLDPQVRAALRRRQIQRKAEREGSAPSAGPNGKSAPGTLPDTVRRPLEAHLGAELGHVRVHANDADAPAIGAQAFAHGNDVHFAPGKYDPSSREGRQLIAHEVTHVVQQGAAPKRGRAATTETATGSV